MQTWVTVMTGVSPSFRVGVSFRAISLRLILKWVLVVINIFMNQKLPLDGHIYTLTAGRVLYTNVLQIYLGRLLFRATLKDRLGSCLSTALEMGNLTAPKSMHIKNSQLVYGRGSFMSGNLHC